MPATSFELLDLLSAAVATVFVVATLLALPMGWVRAACLAGAVVGYGIGWALARSRTWEYKLLLPPAATLVGLAVGWGIA
jgi:hypothetical protein